MIIFSKYHLAYPFKQDMQKNQTDTKKPPAMSIPTLKNPLYAMQSQH